MKKGTANSIEAGNPVLDRLQRLSKIQRIALWAGLLSVLIGAFVYFSYLPKFKKIDSLKGNLSKLEAQLEVAKKNAQELNAYRKKMHDVEEEFQIVMRALPEKEEIPTLLTGISNAGKESGLDFILWQPRPELQQDFYAEIPVAVKVSGDYHGVATFFENVAEMNRIVNIRDIDMTPDKQGDGLTATCTVVTYKFIEAPDTPAPAPQKPNRKKR
jgi:type IV pilus assembly protein PilO